MRRKIVVELKERINRRLGAVPRSARVSQFRVAATLRLVRPSQCDLPHILVSPRTVVRFCRIVRCSTSDTSALALPACERGFGTYRVGPDTVDRLPGHARYPWGTPVATGTDELVHTLTGPMGAFAFLQLRSHCRQRVGRSGQAFWLQPTDVGNFGGQR